MMSELQIETLHMSNGSTITIYGSGRTYFKIDTYEGELDEEEKSIS